VRNIPDNNKPIAVDDLVKHPNDAITLEKLDTIISHLLQLRDEHEIGPIVNLLYECLVGCEGCGKILDEFSKDPNQEMGLTKIESLILELQKRYNNAATDFVWKKLKSSNEDILILKKK
jgi:hypothetical protein